MSKIKNLKDLKAYFRKLNKPIIGVGLNAFNRLGIEDIYPQYEIICFKKRRDFSLIAKDIKSSSIAGNTRGARKNSLGVIKHQDIKNYLNQLKDPFLLFYKDTKNKEIVCRRNNWNIIGQATDLEDKTVFRKIMEKCGLPYIPGEIVSADNLDWLKLKQKYGKFVIQIPSKGGGKGTFFIFSQADFSRAKKNFKRLLKEKDGNQLVATKFIKGYAPSITCCITRQGVLYTNPQLQVIDIPEVIKLRGRGMFCGHDWTASCFSNKVARQIYDCAEKLGSYFKKKGYKGIFGLDFIVDKKTEQVYLLECNARLLGSMPTLTMIQLQNQEIPLLALHVLEFLKVKYKLAFSKVNKLIKKPKTGSQLILFNKYGQFMKNKRSLKPGAYILKNRKLVFMRPGYQMRDIKSQNEFLLADGLPYAGTIFRPNARIMRLLSMRSILDKRTYQLQEWARRAVGCIYKELKMVPAP